MTRLNDIFRRLLQSGIASSKQRQRSVRLRDEYSDQEDHHAQGGDIRRWQRKRFPETSEADDEMPNIGDSSMTHTEPVESQSSRSSAMVPAVYREPLEQDGSWANSSDLLSRSSADGRNPDDGAARPQSGRQHRVPPSSSNGVRLETRAYDDMVRPDDGRRLWYNSPGNENFSFAEARDIDYQPSETEPEVIEPVIYEHEVWNLDRGAPEVYYYIVPGGLNVIFRDENGTESMRVGEFGDSIYKPRRVSPTIIQDEFGNELYRTGDFGYRTALAPSSSDEDDDKYLQSHSRFKGRQHVRDRVRGNSTSHENRHHVLPSYAPVNGTSSKAYSAISYASVPSNAANIILIDDRGQQIPIRTSGSKSPSSIANAHRPRQSVYQHC